MWRRYERGRSAASACARNLCARRWRSVGLRVVASGAAEQPGDGGRACRLPLDAELRVRVVQVPLDGSHAERQRPAIPRCPALGGQPEHVELAGDSSPASAARRPPGCGPGQEPATSSRNTGQAGSSPSTMWLALSSTTSRAPAMRRPGSGSPRSRPSGRRGSAAPVSGSRAVATGPPTFGPLRCRRALSAFLAEVDTRCSSSSQRICSSVAPGIIIEVNTRRNAESGRAQPTLISRSNASSSSRSVGVGSRERRGVAAVEDQPGDPLRVPRRVRDRRRPALRHGHQREPVQPGVVDDRLEVRDACLEPEVLDVPVGQPVPALVVADDGGDLAEVGEEVPPHRALPVVLEVAQPAGGDHERRPGPVPRVGDARAVGRPAEPQLLRWRPRSTTGGWHASIVVPPGSRRQEHHRLSCHSRPEGRERLWFCWLSGLVGTHGVTPGVPGVAWRVKWQPAAQLEFALHS